MVTIATMLAEPSSAAVSILIGELPQPEYKLVPQLWIASPMLAQQLTVFFATLEEVANSYALCWGELLVPDGRERASALSNSCQHL